MSDVVERSMVTTLSKLPDDVLEEILSRIPATTLKRFKTTCKKWNHLSNNKVFARKQFDKAEKQFMSLMLMGDFEIDTIRVKFHKYYGPDIKFGDHELSLVDPSASPSSRFGITDVVHCDGLLFVQSETRVAIWNPLTGQSRWIEKSNCRHGDFCFGYSKKSKSYKILNFDTSGNRKDSEIYELDSDSWRVVDDVVAGMNDENGCFIVCLKGDSYWFGNDVHSNLCLHRFDFSTEKFGCVPLPYRCTSYEISNITVVREEKLAVLLQLGSESNTELWLSNKIDETKVVSWSFKVALDLSDVSENGLFSYTSFLLDEEKKVIVYCGRLLRRVKKNDEPVYCDMLYIIKENSDVTTLADEDKTSLCVPSVLNYVPNLVPIVQAQGSKGKRGIDQAQGCKRKRGSKSKRGG